MALLAQKRGQKIETGVLGQFKLVQKTEKVHAGKNYLRWAEYLLFGSALRTQTRMLATTYRYTAARRSAMPSSTRRKKSPAMPAGRVIPEAIWMKAFAGKVRMATSVPVQGRIEMTAAEITASTIVAAKSE